jgi:hypothetical protein|tara:strand:- start:46 stop:1086 length:1041 start_codon:yes stop_codon:yes gene_type:complete
MAFTTVNKSTDFFKTVLYTGDASVKSITDLSFTPGLVWIKGGTQDHVWTDQVRGATKYIRSNTTNTEATVSGVTSFNSDGFTLGSANETNESGVEFYGWNWKANGQGSSNTDGTINTLYTSASTTSGFSINTYTGTGSNATVGHGLGVAPEVVMVKNLDNTRDWAIYHKYTTQDGTGAQYYLHLNNIDPRSSSSTFWQDAAPNSTVFSIGTSTGVNTSSENYVAYCFAPVQGFSKFGYYNGTGNLATAPFIYTGFTPAYFLIKMVNGSDSWFIYDNARSPFNVRGKYLVADGSGTNSNADFCDFLSNGIKIRTTASALNGNGTEFIYMAFASSPLVGSNDIPGNAK